MKFILLYAHVVVLSLFLPVLCITDNSIPVANALQGSQNNIPQTSSEVTDFPGNNQQAMEILSTKASKSADTLIQPTSSFAAEPETTDLSCGQVVRESVALSENLECSSTDGLVAGADGITIDLNGFTIAGPGGESSKVGVWIAKNDGVHVTGGTITGFQAGVFNRDGSDNKISKVALTENQIAIFNVGDSNTNIEANNIFSNSIGVSSNSSTGTTMHQNTLTDNELGGVVLVNSDENVLDDNTITGSVNGVFLDGQSTNNNVNTNTIGQNSGLDINNGNGLPSDINANTFTDNLCRTSVPDGLCMGE